MSQAGGRQCLHGLRTNGLVVPQAGAGCGTHTYTKCAMPTAPGRLQSIPRAERRSDITKTGAALAGVGWGTPRSCKNVSGIGEESAFREQ
jgi:hypothetical protein